MSAQSRTELLRKVVQLAPQLGWHKETVREAARQLGLPSIAHGLLADGPMDAIAFHLEQQQRAVEMEPVQGKCVFPKAEIPSNSLSSLESFKSFNITNQNDFYEKAFVACQKRLQLNAPFMPTWHQAIGVILQPENIPRSTALLTRIADDIARRAGDQSFDMNWYARRAALSSVYAAADLYMTQDCSPSYTYTWRFLRRRLQEVADAESSVQQAYPWENLQFANF